MVVLFVPDHYNGFFYRVTPSFCLGIAATAVGDHSSLAGEIAKHGCGAQETRTRAAA